MGGSILPPLQRLPRQAYIDRNNGQLGIIA
jgi:hypothetical protein